MIKYNPQNERIKRAYFTYLKEARRYSDSTLDGVAKALHRFESYTGFRDFKTFRKEQASAFKRHLAQQRSLRTKEALSKSTLYSTLTALKNFFQWLAGHSGYKSRFCYSDAEYFNLSGKDTSIAKAHREQRVPTLEQIKHVLHCMPIGSEIERRNRALVAFALLTGARDNAIASLKLKHIDVIEGKVDQDARDVRTKSSKTFTTWFFPVGDDVRQIVIDWVTYLRVEKLWGHDDPLFPATRVMVGSTSHFEACGLDQRNWSDAAPIRKIFKKAFTEAGLPYFNPHSFRKTLAQLGEQRCRSPEEFKAWSQNLAHDHVLTTFSSYGQVSLVRQAEIIRDLAEPKEVNERATHLVRELAKVHGMKV
jgi:integrase